YVTFHYAHSNRVIEELTSIPTCLCNKMQGHCCFLAVMQAGCFLLSTNIFVIDKVINSPSFERK
ncbi:MAG TPA: hypothetical protein PK736_08420, partial [Bacteroidia bacterium]|nr:hypothetical protein [Bacteroidia bacterium]